MKGSVLASLLMVVLVVRAEPPSSGNYGVPQAPPPVLPQPVLRQQQQGYSAPAPQQSYQQYNSPPAPHTQSAPVQSNYGAPQAHQSFTPSRGPQQSSYSAPAPQQSSYSAPAPQQSSYSAPAPQQSDYSAPAPQQSGYSAPQQQSYSAPVPQSGYNAAAAPQQSGYNAPEEQQGGKIHKHVYVHVAPDYETEERSRPKKPLPPPEKHYKILFIKAPSNSYGGGEEIQLPPAPETKTLVYVLLRKPEFAGGLNFPTPAPTQPSKPEVYFIRYKGGNKEQKQEQGSYGAPQQQQQQQQQSSSYSAPVPQSYSAPAPQSQYNAPSPQQSSYSPSAPQQSGYNAPQQYNPQQSAAQFGRSASPNYGVPN